MLPPDNGAVTSPWGIILQVLSARDHDRSSVAFTHGAVVDRPADLLQTAKGAYLNGVLPVSREPHPLELQTAVNP